MPLYEYRCAGCGERVERMRSVADRAKGPECPSCGEPTGLALSAPGRVGAGSARSGGLPPVGRGGCGPGGCGVSFN